MIRARARAMSALDQAAVHRAWPALLPGLLRRGLSCADAMALAHNAAFLYHAVEFQPPMDRPARLLERLSLAQIASLCEAWQTLREELEETELLPPPDWKQEEDTHELPG